MSKKKAAPKKSNVPVEKDDGTRWTIHDHETGVQIYPGNGIIRQQAERLATGMVRPASIREVLPDQVA